MFDSREPTDADLDRLIEQKVATLPGKVRHEQAVGIAPRPSKAAIIRAIRGAGDMGMTAKQLAKELGTTTRQVQLVLCNAIYHRESWIDREKPFRGSEYVYLLRRQAA